SRTDCAGKSWWRIRSRPMIALKSTVPRRAPDEYGTQAAAAHAKDEARDRRLRHSSARDARRRTAVPHQSMVGLFADLRPAPAPRARQRLSVPEADAACLAPRFLAADRRAARERPRLHPRAASRFLRHRNRYPQSAAAERPGRPEPGAERR